MLQCNGPNEACICPRVLHMFALLHLGMQLLIWCIACCLPISSRVASCVAYRVFRLRCEQAFSMLCWSVVVLMYDCGWHNMSHVCICVCVAQLEFGILSFMSLACGMIMFGWPLHWHPPIEVKWHN